MRIVSTLYYTSLEMIEDGTKYGTDHERYRISGIVLLEDLAEDPIVARNDYLSPDFLKDKSVIQQRITREGWDPTLERNRLTARVTTSTWVSIMRRLDVSLQDGRQYPVLVLPKNAEIHIDKGTALLAVLRTAAADWACEPLEGSLTGSKWCVVDFLLHGKLLPMANEAKAHSLETLK